MYPYETYDGELYVNGKLQKNTSISDAEKAGIVTIQQELALVDEMSVQENIFLSGALLGMALLNGKRCI
jgi:ABC-type sugar transport system ATPase subunit